MSGEQRGTIPSSLFAADDKVRLPPVGFWSYSRLDDELSGGKLSAIRRLLQAELQQQYGKDRIQIFQDAAAISHGAEWEQEIGASLSRSTFFIPIITPGFIQSEWCCREVAMFLQRERELFAYYPELRSRSRIFPVLWIDFESVDPHDPSIVEALKTRQWFDYSGMRFRSLEDEQVQQAVAQFATSIRTLLSIKVRRTPPPPSSAPSAPLAKDNIDEELQDEQIAGAEAEEASQGELLRPPSTDALSKQDAAPSASAETGVGSSREAGQNREEALEPVKAGGRGEADAQRGKKVEGNTHSTEMDRSARWFLLAKIGMIVAALLPLTYYDIWWSNGWHSLLSAAVVALEDEFVGTKIFSAVVFAALIYILVMSAVNLMGRVGSREKLLSFIGLGVFLFSYPVMAPGALGPSAFLFVASSIANLLLAVRRDRAGMARSI
jgi:hypothetical protein